MKDPLRVAVLVPALAAIGLLVSMSPVSAKTTQTQIIDCGMGQSINQALSMGDFDKPLVVTVRGKCNESVTIARNDVTLQGDSLMGAEVIANSNTSAITVYGATRVVIDRLTVTGGQHGIFVRYAHGVSISNSTIRGAAIDGVRVLVGHAQIIGSSVINAGQDGVSLYSGSSALVTNNPIQNNGRAGIHVERNSDLNASGNAVSANAANGIELLDGSVARLSNNTITGNSGIGVRADSSVANVISNSSITANSGGGVAVFVGSVLVVADSNISGNGSDGVLYHNNSTGEISNASINNNTGNGIMLKWGSRLQITGPNMTNATGNYMGRGLWCAPPNDDSSVVNTSKLNPPDTNCRILNP